MKADTDEVLNLLATTGSLVQVLIDSGIRNHFFDVNERARLRDLMNDLDKQLRKLHGGN